MTTQTEQLLADANTAGVELQITDLELALTMLDRADLSDDRETVRRNRRNAHAALIAVRVFLGRLEPTSEQWRRIDPLLTRLASRLDHAASISHDLD